MMPSIPTIAEEEADAADDSGVTDDSPFGGYDYSDEYIQSIYSTAIAASSSNSSKKTAATAKVSIDESISERNADEDDNDDEEEPSQRSTASSFMPVPPAMMNHPFFPPTSTTTTAMNLNSPPLPHHLNSSVPPAMMIQPLPLHMMQKQPPSAKTKVKKTVTVAPTATHGPETQRTITPPPPPSRPATTTTSTTTNSGGGDGTSGAGGTTTTKGGSGAILAASLLLWNRVFRRYYAMKLVGMLLAIYTALLSFTYVGTFGKYGGVIDPETGYIIDTNSTTNTEAGIIRTASGVERAVVAVSSFELVALAIARLTAFYMYPALVMVFFTKFRATMQFLSKTPLSMFTYEDLHELHVFSGWTILINGLAHTCFHIFRWISQNNMELLWNHFSGISGIIITLSMMFICLPMLIYKKQVRYEIRKGLHYFFILFCLGMCFHAPTSSFPNGGFATWGFTTLILWWVLDFSYCHFFMTEKIDSTIFHVVPTGVQLTMRVSKRFQKTGVRGGYCYVNFPWLSRYEWHAFSLFENPANPAERQIFMEKVGDWTTKLHKTLQRDTSRPIWVQGPFSSPYDSANEYDHQILVAGGIGITPALSVMRAHKTTRRTNLIWAVRDPHMLEFFLRRAEFSERGWNLIFYTGKERTYVGDQSDIITSTGARVHIIKSRPDFNQLIPNLIYSIESKKSVPEAYIPDAKIEALQFLKERLVELDQESFLDNQDKIRALIEDAESFGFLFTDLVTEFFGEDVSSTLQKSLRAAEGTNLMERESNVTTPEGTRTKEIEPLLPVDEGSKAQGDHSPVTRTATIINEEQILSGLRKIERGQSVRFFMDASPMGGTLSPRNASVRSLVRGLSMRNISCRNIVHYERTMPRQESMSTRAWKAVTLAADDWAKEHVPTFKPWEEDPAESKAYVKAMDPEVLKCWGMLYCGGKSPLADNAYKAASDFGLEMHMESFAW